MIFFSASEEEYSLIFTSGATAALKLVGEIFSWTAESTFAYTLDSHSSVLGNPRHTAANGLSLKCDGLDELKKLESDTVVDRRLLNKADINSIERSSVSALNMLAFPAEGNFSGLQHSLKLVSQIQQDSGIL